MKKRNIAKASAASRKAWRTRKQMKVMRGGPPFSDPERMNAWIREGDDEPIYRQQDYKSILPCPNYGGR